MIRSLAGILAAGITLLGGHSQLAGNWRGHYDLPTSVAFSLELHGTTATVTLPTGYPGPTLVPVQTAGGHVRFTLAGGVHFDGSLRNGAISGEVTQGPLHGSFVLRHGAPLDTGPLGVYRMTNGDGIAVAKPGSPSRLLIDYDTARVHGLYGDVVGSGLATRTPPAGSATFTRTTIALTVDGVSTTGTRVPTHETQVLFHDGNVLLAGTLSMPAAPGTHPALAMVHGSGFTTRSDTALLTDYFVSRGFAVLAYDKRGTGQSGGSWPGELATPISIGTYAKDAEAAARFLAAQPGVDRARVGLAGASQAGWIMPLAAARERAIRFLVLWAAPTVTTGEQQTYQDLTGEGASTPSLTHEQIIAEVRKDGPSGFDPMPSVRKLHIPTLWLYGDIDQHVPTDLCVEKLAHLGGDVTVHVFPSADHFLLVTEHALQSEELRTSRFAPGTFTAIDDWLAAHHL